MKTNISDLRLLLVGAAQRVLIAGLVVAALWMGYFWATATQGGL